MTVILGSRDLQKGERAAAQLIDAGLQVLSRQLDVTAPESITRLAAQVAQEYGRLDDLVISAG